jgi:hypothetical protein
MSQARPITRRTAAQGAAAAATASPRLGLALLVIATAQLMVVLDGSVTVHTARSRHVCPGRPRTRVSSRDKRHPLTGPSPSSARSD